MGSYSGSTKISRVKQKSHIINISDIYMLVAETW